MADGEAKSTYGPLDSDYDVIGMLTRHGMAAVQSPSHMAIGDLMLRARDRIAELEAALRSVLDMQANRYACASEYNKAFADARKVLDIWLHSCA